MLVEMEDGYSSSETTYHSTYSSDNDSREEEGTVENSFLSALPRDVVLCNLWSILMDRCKQRHDMVKTLCTLRSVCSGWRRWIRGTLEGTMYVEAFTNHLIDLYVLDEMEDIRRSTIGVDYV